MTQEGDGSVHKHTQAFRSGALETDEAYSYKFTKPGVYQYFCTLHPLMTGKVIVK
jgi:plastocyanin